MPEAGRKAVIMAGGFGTRLRPLTVDLPKPMVPVANVPMMEHIVHLLRRYGFTQLMSLLYFFPEKITAYFGNGTRFGVSMDYMMAEADYGTAGSVRNAYQFLDQRFLVISGDVLCDFDLEQAWQYHQQKQADATIVLTRVDNPLPFGIVMLDEDGRIVRFLEKPSWGEVFSDTINTGIYILEPHVLELIPYQREFDFSKDLYPLMLRKGMRLYGYIADGYWQDIGNLSQYQQAHRDVLQRKVQIDIPGEESDGNYIDPSAEIHPTARVEGSVIGRNVRIGAYAVVRHSVVGDGTEIGEGAQVVGSVLWSNVKVGKGAELSEDIVAHDVDIGAFATIAENVFIAHHCRIGDYAQLLPNIKLWPNKQVEARAVLSRSLVQEEKWLRELFTGPRITGTTNVEINPDFGARFGAAFGNALGKGVSVVASRDPALASRMIKRSITAGLMSAGISVVDLQVTPLPLTRQFLAAGNQLAGIHVRRSPVDPSQTDIIVLDKDGRDLSSGTTKKVERLFIGENIRRVAPEEVGSITYPERTMEGYISRYTQALQLEALQQRRFTVVIDYSYGIAATMFPKILGELQVQAVALNAYVDPIRSTRDEQRLQEALQQLSHLVTSLRADAGFVIDPGAEKIFLVDEQGNVCPQGRLLTIVVKLFLETHREWEPYKIAVPISATEEVEMIAGDYDVAVVRIQNSHSAMIEATRDPDVKFVGGTRGGFIFPEFFIASDAMFTIGKILEMLALTHTSVAELDGSLPRRVQLVEAIDCPWEKRGTVMRYAMEMSEGKRRILVDGVKIYENGVAVLIIPDRERPVFYVFAEADTEQEARQYLQQYAELLKQWREAE